MGKLKTLEELEEDLLIFYGACSHCTNFNYSKIKPKEHPLKQEAIKWAKSTPRDIPELKQFIKHFFNITEEDLKNG